MLQCKPYFSPNQIQQKEDNSYSYVVRPYGEITMKIQGWSDCEFPAFYGLLSNCV